MKLRCELGLLALIDLERLGYLRAICEAIIV
jgi:hypothetical protein